MKYLRCIYLSMLFTLVACGYKDHAFIYDPYDPRMPQYSEEGANTAGAYINGDVWISQKVLFFNEDDQVTGRRGDVTIYVSEEKGGSYIAFEGGEIQIEQDYSSLSTVSFFLKDVFLRSEEDIRNLERQSFELGQTQNYGQYTSSRNLQLVDSARNSEGTLFIRRVGTNDYGEFFFSGTFGFKVPSDLDSMEVFSGRFDYELVDFNFQAL
ncbi:MAG: hypothetical protein ACI8QH_001000 [Flammeovirgaceae bacterium]|jgi:hypothetical protein